MHYYKVRLGVDSKWKSSSYVYSSEKPLEKQTLVRVPFGKKKKWAVIDEGVEKPKFKIKEIIEKCEAYFPSKTLSFLDWYKDYYTITEGLALTQFLPSFLSSVPNTKNPKYIKKIPELGKTQLRAVDKITSTTKPTVLHGITGSGKTRVYIDLILKQVEKGKSCLLLLPEISLTSQVIDQVSKFVEPLLFHSSLTDKQRSDTWFTVLSSDAPRVVIGTRSSLFLPFKDLGLVIIDEAHETSYKQETGVRYSGLYAAAGLAKSHGAKLLLGSATPPIIETEHILSSGGNLVCMHELAIESKNSKETTIINKKDKESFKRNDILSDQLIDSIQRSLNDDEQSLLYLNRRGTAKLMLCSSCKWSAECQYCELPLTYHHDTDRLMCHTCGKTYKTHKSCPDCSSKVELKTLGTKAIATEIRKIFSDVKVGRFDSDNRKDDSFAENYDSISRGDIDIIIGTQQLVKGLDLPLLSTVGVIDADTSLNFPDFSSDERTFQLISQVSGRVGRGHKNGRIYIQSFQPNNKVIQFARGEDWHGFYNSETKLRQKHSLPPHIHIAKLVFRNKSLGSAIKSAEKAKSIVLSGSSVYIDGPILSFFAKRNGYFYVQLHVKSKSRRKLLQSTEKLDDSTIVELDPISLL